MEQISFLDRIRAQAAAAREQSGTLFPKADAAAEKEEKRHRAILRAPSKLPPETEDLCATCGKTAQRYAAFRDGKVWRLVCRACHDAAYQPLGPVPCSGCNAPARVVTMLNGRVICAACRVRP